MAQAELEGFERKKVKEIDEASEALWATRKKRMKLSATEGELVGAVAKAMRKAGVEIYRDDRHSPPLLVTLKAAKDGVTIKDLDDEEARAEKAKEE